MHFVAIGKYTFNLDNVTVVIDYGEVVAVVFSAAWPNPNDPDHCIQSSRNLTGDDAEAMRRYIARLADDARAQVR
jgi:hypothetical protein